MAKLSVSGILRTHSSWVHMRQRCTNEKNKYFAYYGGRGITVCERWKSFDAFVEDMGIRPEGRTLDRIDPNGNYEPDNCRWATPKEQSANQRPRKIPNRSHLVGAKHPYSPKASRSYRKFRREMKEQGLGPSSSMGKAKNAEAQKARWAAMPEKKRAEIGAAITAAQIGKLKSKKRIKNLRASWQGAKGNRRKKHMSKLLTGRAYSAETLQKMSDGAKRRWAKTEG
jgi:hypothetical protein